MNKELRNKELDKSYPWEKKPVRKDLVNKTALKLKDSPLRIRKPQDSDWLD